MQESVYIRRCSVVCGKGVGQSLRRTSERSWCIGISSLKSDNCLNRLVGACVEQFEQRCGLGEGRYMGNQRLEVEPTLGNQPIKVDTSLGVSQRYLSAGLTPEICEQTISIRLWWNSSPKNRLRASPWKNPIATAFAE